MLTPERPQSVQTLVFLIPLLSLLTFRWRRLHVPWPQHVELKKKCVQLYLWLHTYWLHLFVVLIFGIWIASLDCFRPFKIKKKTVLRDSGTIAFSFDSFVITKGEQLWLREANICILLDTSATAHPLRFRLPLDCQHHTARDGTTRGPPQKKKKNS